MKLELTEQERWTAINALRCAATEYERIAVAGHRDGNHKLYEQVAKQADDARSLADKIEGAE